MSLRKITCVSFPRSGHHLLVNMLLKYFSRDLSYPDIHEISDYRDSKQILHAGGFHYCEYYTHCRAMPCPDKTTNFQKTHDFHLNVPIVPAHFYIIQYRHPLESIVSLYQYMVLYHQLPDNKNSWLQFIDCFNATFYRLMSPKQALKWLLGKRTFISRNPLIYWKGFVAKWLIRAKAKNMLAVPYSALTADSTNTLAEVVRFISPAATVDERRISAICGQIVRPFRNIKSFQYYEDRLFHRMENYFSEDIRALNLKRYFE